MVKTELQRIEESEMFIYSHPSKREAQQCYGMVKVMSCQREDWWYKNLIGVDVFCLLQFMTDYTGQKILTYAQAVMLTGTTIQRGRDFDIKDIILI